MANLDWSPAIRYLRPDEAGINKFAFVIHPLSVKFIHKAKWLHWTKYLPDELVKPVALCRRFIFAHHRRTITATGSASRLSVLARRDAAQDDAERRALHVCTLEQGRAPWPSAKARASWGWVRLRASSAMRASPWRTIRHRHHQRQQPHRGGHARSGQASGHSDGREGFDKGK
jgi:hypothetical protein